MDMVGWAGYLRRNYLELPSTPLPAEHRTADRASTLLVNSQNVPSPPSLSSIFKVELDLIAQVTYWTESQDPPKYLPSVASRAKGILRKGPASQALLNPYSGG